ncbi:MAG: alpha/beta hydrolase [Acidimicrobiales bacterium]|nr:alpha/beta hydrolase [Acidimicrobiales bacterium]
MARATVDGVGIGYEVVGEGRPWVITPGARAGRDVGGVRELAEALAEAGNQVVIWDRPNCGESDVCFEGPSESDLQADCLAGLLRHLDLGPTIIAGGSGGSRVSLLTAARHPDVAAGLALWWITGGVLGSIGLGWHYCNESIRAAFHHGMDAVVELPAWREQLERNPDNRHRMLELDRDEFIATMERWMLVYCPCDETEIVAGLSAADAARLQIPALVFRSGASDLHHPRATSEQVAEVLPNAELVEPPWGDREWHDRQDARTERGESLFGRWPLLAPQLLAWADGSVG